MATYHFNFGNSKDTTGTSSALKNLDNGYIFGYGTGKTTYEVNKSTPETTYTDWLWGQANHTVYTISSGDLIITRKNTDTVKGYDIKLTNIYAHFEWSWSFGSTDNHHPKYKATISCGGYTFSQTQSMTSGIEGEGDFLVGSMNNTMTVALTNNEAIKKFNKNSTIKVRISFDLTEVDGSGDYGSTTGPYWIYPSGQHKTAIGLRELFCEFDLPLADFPELQFGDAPSGLTISNNNPKSSSTTGVSKSTNSISVKWSATADPTCDGYSFRYKKSSTDTWGAWSNKTTSSNSGTFSITDLPEGTTYNIEVKCKNEIGSSATKSITIRTLYKAPVITVTLPDDTDHRYIEQLWFKVESDKPLAQLQYRYKKTSDTGNGTSKTQTVENSVRSDTIKVIDQALMRCNTSYTIYVKGVSTSTYDSQTSSEVSRSGTTRNANKLKTIAAIEHDDTNTTGIPISITINTITTGMHLTIKVGDYTKTITVENNTASVNMPVDWDAIYKEYAKSNSVTASFTLETRASNYLNYADMIATDKATYNHTLTGTITLKGKQKTVHVGVNNAPKRVRVWVGDSSGKAKRAVTWVGTPSGTTNRTI